MSVKKTPISCMNAESGKSVANVAGTNMIDCAKMIGITPAAFTLTGRYWVDPP